MSRADEVRMIKRELQPVHQSHYINEPGRSRRNQHIGDISRSAGVHRNTIKEVLVAAMGRYQRAANGGAIVVSATA